MAANILVVDDEPDLELLVTQHFRKQIRRDEYRFRFARNGAEAIEILRTVPDIDLVLSDINMPVMDGLTLLAKINEVQPPLQAVIVIVSAYGDMPNIRTAMNRGAFDFLTKPMDFADVETTIDKTLRHMSLLRKVRRYRDDLLAMQRDLEVGAEIQQSILPKVPAFADRTDFELHAAMYPAKEVGGDFYDFFLLDEHRLALVIGDVSGKGVPAAIFMAMARTVLRAVANTGVEPGACLESVNNQISRDNESSMFVTLFYGILDTRTGELSFANGGHNLPMLLRARGSVEVLMLLGGPLVGAFAGSRYQTAHVKMAPGDSLLLYTDGVTEAFGPGQRQFGEERLLKHLHDRGSESCQEIIDSTVQRVREFADTEPQSDDITMLAVRYKGPAAGGGAG